MPCHNNLIEYDLSVIRLYMLISVYLLRSQFVLHGSFEVDALHFRKVPYRRSH